MSVTIEVGEHDPLAKARRTKYPSGLSSNLLYAITFGPGCLLLAVVWLQERVPVAYLLKDPLTVAEVYGDCCHVYYGLVSNVGIALWVATSAVCLFTALLLALTRSDRGNIVFMAAAGIFTACLMLDDLFMVHEDVLPVFGVSQPMAYGLYGALGAIYLGLAWRQILNARVSLLIAAIVLLGASAGMDTVLHSESDLHIFSEDGAKLLGILAWTGFHVSAALDLCVAAVAQPRPAILTR